MISFSGGRISVDGGADISCDGESSFTGRTEVPLVTCARVSFGARNSRDTSFDCGGGTSGGDGGMSETL